MKSRTRFFRFCSAFFAILTVGFAPSAFAGSYVWQNSGPSNNWSTDGGDANWFVDAGTTLSAWVDGNDAVFAGATGETIALPGTVSPTTTTVNDAGSWTLNGAGVLGGAGALVKNGAGTLTLANTTANTYSGGTTISGGTLSIGTGGTAAATSTVGALGASPVAVNGGTLKLWIKNDNAATAPWTIPNAVNINGGTILGEDGINAIGGVVTVGANGATFSAKWGGKTLAFPGGIAGTGNVTIRRAADGGGEASATVIYNGANTYAGTTTVTSGILQADGNQAFNRLKSNAAVVVDGGAFEIRGVNALPSAANSVDVTVNQDGTLRVVSGGSTAIGAGGTSHGHIRNLVLNGGIASLEYSGGGGAYNGESFQLNGSLTVGGTVPSRVNIGANTNANVQGIALGGTTPHTFTIADVTGNENIDFIVNAELENSDAGAGALTKEGLGTMSLNFANSYTGATVINAGGIVLAGNGSLSTSAVTVNTTGSFGIQAPGKTLPALTVNTGAALALPAATGATTNVTGALTFGAAAVVGVTPVLNSPAAVGEVFDLLTAGSVSGTATFNTVLPSTTRVTGTTALNGNKLQFTVTTGGANLVWNGGTGVWETNGPTNFLNGSTADTFKLYDAVTFNDAIGAGDHTATVTSVVSPSLVTVNNSLGNYTFDGAGSIVGGSLVKSGTSNLVLGGTNTYGFTGSVTVTGGTLDLGAHTLSSTSSLVLDGGTLTNGTLAAGTAFDVRSGASTAILSGSGKLTKSTAGTVTLNAANTYAGGTAVSGGTLVLAGGSLGSGPVTVSTGGRLNLDVGYGLANTMTVDGGTLGLKKGTTITVDAPSLVLSGSGTTVTSYEGTGETAVMQGFDVNSPDIVVNTGTVGAVIDSSVVIATRTYGFRIDVNGTGELTVAGPITGTGAAGGAVESGTMIGTDSTALWKRGTGTLTLTGASTFTAGTAPNPGATAIQDGVLRLSGGNDRLPVNSAVYLGSTANANGKLALNGISQTITGLTVIGTGTSNAVVGASTSLSTLTINNTNDYTYSGAIGGVGTNENKIAITKSGAGTLTLSGAYSYSGDTTVSGGKLILGTATLDDGAAVRFNGAGSTLELPAGSNDTVRELWIDGVPMEPGTWGAAGATNISNHFSGTGIITVRFKGVAPGYVTWTGVQGLVVGTNAGKGDDPDEDGLNNLAEYALDGAALSGNSTGKVVSSTGAAGVTTFTLPVRKDVTGFVVAANGKSLVSEAGSEVAYRIEASTDLVNWTLPVTEVAPVTADMPGLSDPLGWGYRSFQVAAGNTKVFIRAKVEAP